MIAEIIRRNTVAQLYGLLSDPMTNGLWTRMGFKLDEMREKLFREQGGSYGREKFLPVSAAIIGRPRIGTDGQAYGVYYAGMSDLLRASGNYMDSFKALEVQQTGMTYGSDHDLADRIPYAGGRTQRYVMPDVDDYATKQELEDVSARWVDDMMDRAEQIATEVLE